jgi:phosphatidate cytidylyltransferase
MAFNPTVFKERALTAIVFAAAMIGGIFGGRLAFQILFSIVGLGILWELFSLTMPSETAFKRGFYTFLAMSPWWLVNTWWSPFDWLPVFVSLIFLVELFDKKSGQPFANVGQFCLGIFYVAVPLALLKILAIRPENDGSADWIYVPQRVIGLLILTWSSDTFAYLVGSFIGKTPLFARISPKKTWEGTIGSGILTVGLGWILHHFFGEWSLTQWLILGATAAIFGTLGDLVESMLKRSVGVKDSGKLLPGHGGLLDRFDAFIFFLPWAWLVLQVFK